MCPVTAPVFSSSHHPLDDLPRHSVYLPRPGCTKKATEDRGKNMVQLWAAYLLRTLLFSKETLKILTRAAERTELCRCT